MNLKIIIIMALSALLFSCSGDYLPEQKDEIVVEGWIEDNGFPVVILTKNINISNVYQPMDSLSSRIVKWAKVTVSDGEKSVVLTGRYTHGYFPPYIYTTSHFRGEAGKTYRLTVEYGDFHATATTTIPETHRIDELTVERCAQSDTLYQISLRYNADEAEQNYYQIFTRVGGRNLRQYLAAYLGTLDSKVMKSGTKIPVYRGRDINTRKYTPYYNITDTVAVKFAHIDRTSYDFWYDYTRNLSTAANMFFASTAAFRSNIVGGTGYWCGMGSDIRYVAIRDWFAE